MITLLGAEEPHAAKRKNAAVPVARAPQRRSAIALE